MSILPWERQPGETIKGFEAFVHYRDLGGERSLDVVAQRLSKSKTIIARWSGKNKWVSRVIAYDDYLARQSALAKQKAEERQVVIWAERQREHREKAWDLSQKLLKKAEDMLKFPLVRQNMEVNRYEDESGKNVTINTTILEPAGWNMATIARLLDTADHVGRLAAELPTEVIDFVELIRRKGLPLEEIFKDMIELYKDVNVS